MVLVTVRLYCSFELASLFASRSMSRRDLDLVTCHTPTNTRMTARACDHRKMPMPVKMVTVTETMG